MTHPETATILARAADEAVARYGRAARVTLAHLQQRNSSNSNVPALLLEELRESRASAEAACRAAHTTCRVML